MYFITLLTLKWNFSIEWNSIQKFGQAYPCPNTEHFWFLMRGHYKTIHERVILIMGKKRKYNSYFFTIIITRS